MRSRPLKTSVPSGSTPLSGSSQRTDLPGSTAGASEVAPQMPLRSGSRVCASANAGVMNTAATTRGVFMALLLCFVVAEPELDGVAVGEGHLPHEGEVGRVLRVIPENRDRLPLPEVG